MWGGIVILSLTVVALTYGAPTSDHREVRHSLPKIDFPTDRIADKEKREYVTIVERKLKSWEGVTSQLRVGAKGAEEENRRALLERVADDLESKSEQTRQELRELKLATTTDWERFQSSVEDRLKEMQAIYSRPAE